MQGPSGGLMLPLYEKPMMQESERQRRDDALIYPSRNSRYAGWRSVGCRVTAFFLIYEQPGIFLRALTSPVAKDTLPEEYAREVRVKSNENVTER